MAIRREARKQFEEVSEETRKGGCAAMSELCNLSHSSCRYIKENPWAGVGLGAAIGLAVGALLSRK